MRCSLCQHEVAPSLRFCPQCGARALAEPPHLEVVGVAGRMQLFTDRVRVAQAKHRIITQVTDLPLAEIRHVLLGHRGGARYLQLLREGEAPPAPTPAALMQHAGTVYTTQQGVPALAALYRALQACCPQATFTASIPLPAPVAPPPVVAPPVVAPPVTPAPGVPPSAAPAPASSSSASAEGAPSPGSVPCVHCQHMCETGDRFCGACGVTLPVTAANTSPKMMAVGYTILLVIAGVLLWGIVAVVGSIGQHMRAQRPPSTVATAPTSPRTSATASPTHTTPPPRPPRTPSPASTPQPASSMTVDDLLALTDRTLHACNRSGVKRAQWARVKSSEYGPVFEIHFAADDNFTHEAIRDIVALRTFDLLNAIRKTVDIQTVARVSISATFSLSDKYGNVTEDDILRLEFGRSTLTKLNWEQITVSDQVFRAADNVWISPVVAD